MRFNWLFLAGLLFVSACAPQATRQFVSNSRRAPDTVSFFAKLEMAVEEAGTTDRRSTKIPGFPYLAADRFLASMATSQLSPAGFDAWIRQMYELSRESRRVEIRNLPGELFEHLVDDSGGSISPTRDDLWRYSNRLAESMLENDRRKKGFAEAVRAAIDIPDDYSTALRTVGIYPVTALVVAYFSEGFFDQLRSWHKIPPDQLPRLGELVTYRNRVDRPANQSRLKEIFTPQNEDPLGRPTLSQSDRMWLVNRFAPVLVQDSVAEYDSIGRVFWADRNTIGIDGTKPAVYFYFSNAYLDGAPIWQINYVFWYSGRLGENTPWFERGLIDGMTLRISLDRQGNPFMLDMMNNCACSHQFFPKKQRVADLKERSMMFDALVPAWLPERFPREPVQVRVNSGWHQVQHVGAASGNSGEKVYELVPYEALESIPLGDGSYRSMFNENGIAYGSDRIEPYFFFPMGISDVGAMRQRGHHPIALIGRSHFDDPYLFDLHFSWE